MSDSIAAFISSRRSLSCMPFQLATEPIHPATACIPGNVIRGSMGLLYHWMDCLGSASCFHILDFCADALDSSLPRRCVPHQSNLIVWIYQARVHPHIGWHVVHKEFPVAGRSAGVGLAALRPDAHNEIPEIAGIPLEIVEPEIIDGEDEGIRLIRCLHLNECGL